MCASPKYYAITFKVPFLQLVISAKHLPFGRHIPPLTGDKNPSNQLFPIPVRNPFKRTVLVLINHNSVLCIIYHPTATNNVALEIGRKIPDECIILSFYTEILSKKSQVIGKNANYPVR
jgi:hypothetical protein